MSRVVRQSKFRHVFGQAAKPEECYQDLRVTRSAWDANFVKANTKFFAVAWDSAGGGSIAVVRHEDQGKTSQTNPPLLSAHKRAVLDFDWHPFNDHLLASVSEDANVMIWKIPEGGVTAQITDPVQILSGHKRNVGTANFNPVAAHLLATSSNDFSVKLWDVEKGSNVVTVEGHTDNIQSLDWNYNGSTIATSCKDKKLRILDPRTNTVAQEGICHQGVKGSRVAWLKDKVLTVGFSKASEREFNIFDPRSAAEPIAHQNIDTSSGGIMPYFDYDSNLLFLAGKGDGNIRYYELVDEAPYFYYLTEFKSATPQKGIAFLPKRALNVSECEIARALKLHVNKVEPISFRVPRKSDIFQDDLYPDTYAGEPALTLEEWLGGANAEPKTRSLAPGFVAKEKPAAEFNPVQQKQEAPKNEKELSAENEKLKQRVAYLEAELIKRDSKIKDLESRL